MRTIEWLYEQLGKLHAENLILKEEVAKLQAAVNAAAVVKSVSEPEKV
jgi:cell division protein FtsB